MTSKNGKYDDEPIFDVFGDFQARVHRGEVLPPLQPGQPGAIEFPEHTAFYLNRQSTGLSNQGGYDDKYVPPRRQRRGGGYAKRSGGASSSSSNSAPPSIFD